MRIRSKEAGDENNHVAKADEVAAATGDSDNPPVKGFALARIVIAFWLLGMCNNYIYVIMLSAAHDIITIVEERENFGSNVTTPAFHNAEGRECTEMTTGAILLADIVPTLVVKLLCPFLPFFVHFRLFLAVGTGILSLILVAASESYLIAIIGVCFASFNSGLGEITLLAYSTNFPLHAISGWSSGTGGAGLAGSFAYAGLTEVGISPSMALYISISVPVLMAISFWVILKHPKKGSRRNEIEEKEDDTKKEPLTLHGIYKSFIDKLTFMPEILPFMIPVGLVYYFEYLINSGLFDKIIFKNVSMTKESQFRWYNAMYQIGVLVSRSSVTWVHFKRIWIMSLLQGLNVVIFMLEAVYGFIPNVWIMFALIFWEGLLGGAAYVNTFYNMSHMVRKEYRLFALSIASVADTCGIFSAALSSFPVHNFICSLPFKPVFRWPE